MRKKQSKLNNGHQEQLEGVKWSPKTFLLVKVGLKSLDLGLIDGQNPKIIAELKWGWIKHSNCFNQHRILPQETDSEGSWFSLGPH